MFLLAPLVEVEEVDPRDGMRFKVLKPADKYYKSVVDLCNSKAKAWKKHKSELFGDTPPTYTSALYSEMSVAKSLGVPYSEFQEWDIEYRAKMIAHVSLENMMEVLSRHFNIIANNVKRLEEKANKNGS